jgi:hypothetical protein
VITTKGIKNNRLCCFINYKLTRGEVRLKLIRSYKIKLSGRISMNNKDHAISTGVEPVINFSNNQYAKRGSRLARTTFSVCMLIITAVLSACSSSASQITPAATLPPVSAPQNTAVPALAKSLPATSAPQSTAVPSLLVAPTATSGAQQQTVNTQLDPCELINSQEASTLVGVTYGVGKEVTTHDNLKICTYGGQSTNILTVEVVQAPDVATAQADKAQFLADLQSNMQELTNQGLNVTQVPNFADGAVAANASMSDSGVSMSGNAFGFLKGTIFFGFSDLAIGGTAPTDAAMQAEANTVLGRLP